MSSLENFSDLLMNLDNASNMLASLRDIHTALIAISPSVLASIVPQLSFAKLFTYLNTDDNKQEELCCNILRKLLDAAHPGSLVATFKKEIILGLKSPSLNVKELSICQVVRVAKNNVSDLLGNMEIMENVISLLASESASVADRSRLILIKIGSTDEGCQFLFQKYSQNLLTDISKINDVIRYRVYTLLVDIVNNCPSNTSGQYINADHQTSLLGNLLLELDLKDDLLRLNALELLSQLSACEVGLQYLVVKSLPQKLEEILSLQAQKENNSNIDILIPGILKFFGNFCLYQPSLMLKSYPTFLSFLLDGIENRQSYLIGVSIETLGIIGTLPDGKIALESLGGRFRNILRIVGEITTIPPTENRIRALDAIHLLLYLPAENQTPDLLQLTVEWFPLFYPGKDPLAQILSVCRQPFPEIKKSAFSVLNSLALLPWAQRVMSRSSSFREYLLDRKTESAKDGSDLKFDLVKILLQSPTCKETFAGGNCVSSSDGNKDVNTDGYYKKMQDYIKDGRYYMASGNRVAVEESS